MRRPTSPQRRAHRERAQNRGPTRRARPGRRAGRDPQAGPAPHLPKSRTKLDAVQRAGDRPAARETPGRDIATRRSERLHPKGRTRRTTGSQVRSRSRARQPDQPSCPRAVPESFPQRQTRLSRQTRTRRRIPERIDALEAPTTSPTHALARPACQFPTVRSRARLLALRASNNRERRECPTRSPSQRDGQISDYSRTSPTPSRRRRIRRRGQQPEREGRQAVEVRGGVDHSPPTAEAPLLRHRRPQTRRSRALLRRRS